MTFTWLRRCLRLALTALAAISTNAHAVPDTMAQRALACTACHQSDDRQTPDGYVPRIAGKPAGYLFEQMRNFRDGRRSHEIMARLFEHLDDRFIGELAGHFAGLQPSHRGLAPRPQDAAEARRAAERVQRSDPARELPACVACHGTTLTGVAPNVPGLLGLPAAYVAAQLSAWRQGLRKARAPDCMARIARALPAEEIAMLARWLEAQPLPADPRPAAQAPGPWPIACGSLPP